MARKIGNRKGLEGMLIKIKRYIFKPHVALIIIMIKIRSSIRFTMLKLITKIKGINLSVEKNINILQTTIITGKGSISIGRGCSFGFKRGGYYYKGVCELQPRYKNSKITIGENVHTNNNLFICCADGVTIEKDTLIGEGVMIIDYDAHGIKPNERNTSIGNVRPVHIEENVWIGSRVTILAGTNIGKNSIVAAGAVVKGIFPEDVILGGNPAKIIKIIER